MAAVTITIPAGMVTRTKDAMRATFPQYAALTDVQAFQEVTAAYWRQIIRSYETNLASQAAAVTADAKAVTDTAVIV